MSENKDKMIGRCSFYRRKIYSAGWFGVLSAAVLAASGCSNQPPAAHTQDAAKRTEHDAGRHGTNERNMTRSAASASTDSTGKPHQAGQQTVDGIPLDVWPEVWFDNPLEVARIKQSVTISAASGTAVVTTDAQPLPATPSAAASVSEAVAKTNSWNGLLSGDAIKQETKQIRLKLKQAFQSIPRYNGSFKEMRVDMAVLATLAVIAAEHPDPVTWKKQSLHVRDLASELALKATSLGRKRFVAAREVYEKLDEVLNGNIPADLPESTPEQDFSAFAKRSALMRRMQRSSKWLTSNISEEAEFQAHREALHHEAVILETLVKVIATDSYDFSDEPNYQQSVAQMIGASVAIAEAADIGDYDGFTSAHSRLRQACTACHQEYRFADDN